MKKIKVGIIGSGFIADYHCFAFKQIPSVEIIGLSSLLVEQAKKLMKKYEIPGEPIENYQELLKKDFDVVSICLPNFLHKEVAVKALNAGKHVVIEKPLALTSNEGEEIISAAKNADKQIFYCENNIYAPTFRKMKEIIKEGGLGKIYKARGKEQHSGPHSAWFYKKEKSGGGSLIDLGIHDIACLLWFLEDEVESVFCQTSTIQPDRGEFGKCEVEDNAIGILNFKNGAQVSIEESWTAPGGYSMLFEIYGTKGQVIADPCRMTPLIAYSESGYGYSVEKAGSTIGWTYPVPEEAWTFGYPQEMKHFIECIKTGKKAQTDGEFGLKVLKIVELMYKSAKSGKIEEME